MLVLYSRHSKLVARHYIMLDESRVLLSSAVGVIHLRLDDPTHTNIYSLWLQCFPKQESVP